LEKLNESIAYFF